MTSLPDWPDPYDEDEGGLSVTGSDEAGETSEPRTPAAISGSRGKLDTSNKNKAWYAHQGRYPKADEISGPNPLIRASEWVGPRGEVHERKGARLGLEKDYDLFLKHEHGKQAVVDKEGNWHYEEARASLNPVENPKLPGLGT